MRTLRIGSGAGFADDRVDPAVELAEHGRLDHLVFECLAERTIALAQRRRRHDPAAGHDEWLAERMEAVLEPCARRGIRVLTNMGAANPVAAAETTAEVARRLGLTGLRIAAVTGDDVLDLVHRLDPGLLDRAGTASSLDGVLSANAYLGCEPVVRALAAGADVVITGRIADPALYLAPLVHEFGWPLDDWQRLGAGLGVGHLLECAGQLTGGYFADPGVHDVPGLARLGFPLAEVAEDGTAAVTKVAGTGGQVTVATCTEQLLYEVHDPAAYVCPDAVVDFSGAELRQVDEDVVAVSGITGRPRPDRLKVSIGHLDGWSGHGEISYAGPNALARGQLARDVVRERLQRAGVDTARARFDLVGVDAVAGAAPPGAEPPEVRLRVAARTGDHDAARRVGREVTALWLNGPAGGAGATRGEREIVAVASALVPRELVTTGVEVREV